MNWLLVSSGFGVSAVGLGAFGAHALRASLPESTLAVYQTGIQYHLVHAVVLVALALYGKATNRNVGLPCTLLSGGIVLFSGSLYVLALSGMPGLGMITPLGGILLLAGWVSIGIKLR